MYSLAGRDLLSEEVGLDVWICLSRAASRGTTSANISSVTLSGLREQLSPESGYLDQQPLGAKRMLEDTAAELRTLDFRVQV